MKASPFLALVALAAVAACSDEALTGPATPDIQVAASLEPATLPVTVMSRNLYIGTDVDLVIQAVISADPNDDLPALLAAIAEFQNTAFPARAAALAAEIAHDRPHVVGLQEVSIIDVDLTGLGLPIDFDLDYLAILQAHLAALGLNYVPVGSISGIAATLPGVTVIDRDVVLVDADRATWNPASVVTQTFAANLGTVAPGVTLLRGWVSVEVTASGRTFTVANTHLESGHDPFFTPLRAAQAAQLVASLGAASPVILMGDLNEGPGSPMYNIVTGAGFTDSWNAMRPGAAGLTCCELPDLSNRVSAGELDQRIDFIMTRGFGHPNGQLIGRIGLVGITPDEKVDGPAYRIWPSDHAGLVLDLLAPPALGLW